jgi:hypothetical protein
MDCDVNSRVQLNGQTTDGRDYFEQITNHKYIFCTTINSWDSINNFPTKEKYSEK